MTKEKQIPSHSAKDMFNRTDLNPFTRIYPWRWQWSSVLTLGVYENKRERWALANKSIKELKAENKELAELKNPYVAEAEKQNEEIKRLKQRTKARTWAEWSSLSVKMAQTGLFEKVKEETIWKDVDRGLEAYWDAYEKNGQGNIRLRTSKAESEAFEG